MVELTKLNQQWMIKLYFQPGKGTFVMVVFEDSLLPSVELGDTGIYEYQQGFAKTKADFISYGKNVDSISIKKTPNKQNARTFNVLKYTG